MPRYSSQSDFRHDTAARTGVLVANLGTPDAPTRSALRVYLKEFLSDPRVVEIPRWIWLPILYGIVLTFRPGKSAEAYRQVWGADGSPLLSISRRQAAALQTTLDAAHPGAMSVALGMRYGQPSIRDALHQLRDRNTQRILVLPLYPQYAASTTGSVFDAVAAELSSWRRVPEIRLLTPYHDHAQYISALADRIRRHWSGNRRGDRLLISFHGLPRRCLDLGDPYHCHCQKTARLVAEALDLRPDDWQIVFQSRIGRAEWLKPYTEDTLRELPAKGIRSVDIVCPGFSADCLETLEEVDVRYREMFLKAGGEQFQYIPCLNDEPSHISLLKELVSTTAADWLQPPGTAEAGAEILARARALGADR